MSPRRPRWRRGCAARRRSISTAAFASPSSTLPLVRTDDDRADQVLRAALGANAGRGGRHGRRGDHQSRGASATGLGVFGNLVQTISPRLLLLIMSVLYQVFPDWPRRRATRRSRSSSSHRIRSPFRICSRAFTSEAWTYRPAETACQFRDRRQSRPEAALPA